MENNCHMINILVDGQYNFSQLIDVEKSVN